MKRVLKSVVVKLLTRQVRKLRKRHTFKVVGVVGSVGKTSTKLAVAQALSAHARVMYQQGNYNDLVSVPLVYFGQEMPSLFSPIAWLKVLARNNKLIKDYPYDIVVLELGTDGPGQIADFARYGRLDVVVVTSIVPEHMANFTDMTAVAQEELSVASFADKLFYNSELMADEYKTLLPEGSVAYSVGDVGTEYHMANVFTTSSGLEGDVKHGGEILVHFSYEAVATMQLYSVLAAIVVGDYLGVQRSAILDGIGLIRPVSGRLRRLNGINGSVIIDDTYNSSPEAVKSALATLRSIDAPHKIAVLGSMNELGTMSEGAHKEIGDLCTPDYLDVLITIGGDANKFLATSAEDKGCVVYKFDNPYDAGDLLMAKIEKDSVVLAKGSQNGVFAEEAIKKVLHDPEDANKLVRQSETWLKTKAKQFPKT